MSRTARRTDRRPTYLRFVLSIVAAAALLLPTLVLVAPAAAQGGGIGVAPADLSFVDPPLLPGGSKVGTLRFQQQYDEPMQIRIEAIPLSPAATDAHRWLDLSKKGDVIVQPGELPVQVTVRVPATAANGDYDAGVRFTVVSTARPEGSGAVTQTAVTAVLQVRVDRDNEVKQIAVDNQPVLYNAEVGGRIQFVVPLENTGNVDANPHVRFDVRDRDKAVRTHWFNGTLLQPGVSVRQTFMADTDGLAAGQYWGVITVALEGQTVHTTEAVSFDIVERGTLVLSAKLKTILIAGNATQAQAGDLVQLAPVVQNDGPGVVVATFKGSVWLNGKLIDQMESEPLEIAIGATEHMPIVYRVDKVGTYEFEGRVHYAHKVTETKSVLLTVSETKESGAPLLMLGGGVLVGLGVVIWLVRRKA